MKSLKKYFGKKPALTGFTPLEKTYSKGSTKNKKLVEAILVSPSKNHGGGSSLTGFTLVEICIAIVILGIIIGSAAAFFTNIYDLWKTNSEQTEIQQNGRLAMDEMSKYIRQASSPTVTNSVLIGKYDGTEPDESLIQFHLLDGSTIQYYQKDGKLYRNWAKATSGSLETEVSDNLNELYFARENAQGAADNYSIHIATLTLQKGTQSVTLRGYIHLKNP